MRMLMGMIGVAAAVYLIACAALFFSQRSLIYFPQPRHASGAATVVKLQVQGAELDVTARVLAGPDAVIYLGGNAEDVAASLPTLAEVYPAHALYLLHYRGYAGSTGKPSEAALFADALALFDKVRAEHPNVTLIGRSLGSGVATHVASLRPAQALVLVTPYDSIAAIAAQQFPVFPIRLLLRDKFESWRYAPGVTAPTRIIMAEHDEVIPRASSELLLTRFKPGVAERVLIKGAGHNTVSENAAYALLLRIPRREASDDEPRSTR